MNISYTDIAEVRADIIVNAANGIGFMGGCIGKKVKFSGVAESLHYATQGQIEKIAKQKARKVKWIPGILWGHRAGEVYVTGSANLNAKWVIHAVTMRYPGMPARMSVIEKLIPLILEEARKLGAKSIAVPLLGTGTGGLNKEKVLTLYEKYFEQVTDLEIEVILFKK